MTYVLFSENKSDSVYLLPLTCMHLRSPWFKLYDHHQRLQWYVLWSIYLTNNISNTNSLSTAKFICLKGFKFLARKKHSSSPPVHVPPSHLPSEYFYKHAWINTYMTKVPNSLPIQISTPVWLQTVSCCTINTCFPHSAALGHTHSFFDRQGQICNHVSSGVRPTQTMQSQDPNPVGEMIYADWNELDQNTVQWPFLVKTVVKIPVP